MSKILKSRIFIENGTNMIFDIMDTDGNYFFTIQSRCQYSILLNLNSNNEKQYNLLSNGNQMSFWLAITGEISRIQQSSTISSEIIENNNSTLEAAQLNNIFFKNRDHLIIVPTKNPSARAIPIYYVNPIEDVFKLDFTDRS